MNINNEYKSDITKCLNIDNTKCLQSIITAEELKKYCLSFNEKSFKVGERKNNEIVDSHDYRYLDNGDFKANLHCHSQHSDGLSCVENLLNEGVKIADKHSSFVIAITDHDTLDSSKEVLKIISQTPDKYNNLKIVLGVEISTVGIQFKNQQQPVTVHLLVYGINPFDERLNDYLAQKRDLKIKLANQTIKTLNEKLSKDLGFEFDLQEAALVHEMILKGQDEVLHPMKKYTAGKILLNHYLPNADFTYEKPIKKYKYLFKSSQPYYKLYKKALEEYVGFELPPIAENIEKSILKAQEIYEQSHPSIGKMLDEFCSFEETVEFISSLEYGYMCIAHPARTEASNINSSAQDFYSDFFNVYKHFGKDKAVFFEGYYQSYDCKKHIELISTINESAAKYSLIPIGGLDSHGLDVVTRCPYT